MSGLAELLEHAAGIKELLGGVCWGCPPRNLVQNHLGVHVISDQKVKSITYSRVVKKGTSFPGPWSLERWKDRREVIS